MNEIKELIADELYDNTEMDSKTCEAIADVLCNTEFLNKLKQLLNGKE